MTEMGPLWGIDLGGTKIEGVILSDRENPDVLKRLRIPTEAKKGYDHIIQQVARLVEVLTAETGIKPQVLGIGSPGVLDPSTRTMKNCNTTCLNGQPLKRDLELALGIPVRMANDANCFAIAETLLGVVKEKAPRAKTVFGVILGTGVGGGLVVNGEIMKGRHGIAGEWGHVFLDRSGGECYCGKSGCVETLISGPALEAFYKEISGQKKSLPQIIKSYEKESDPAATKTVHRLLHYFGKAMSIIINVIDPDVIVLGGGLGNIDLLYSDGIWEVEKSIFNYSLSTPFLKPKLGDSAGVFGAALL